ncbi:MAG: UDP-N-acetylglucosamine 1-carboxyvinyltransferase [Candidatus Electryonea clarkiae]|nr:UDP-N-acetylglucosamine 1-carboxyvinyltransferase [Candidatus Electryonea clarkiae]MDP8288140.1 UDP-N-acetylglucosamine 1-carboxyvinyltransferase [Candidatus Electryonea clarkiae]
MDKLVIEGGVPLQGEVRIAGAKNATLPLMAAALLAEGKTIVKNAPDLFDVLTMGRVIERLGADVQRHDHTMEIDATSLDNFEAPYELVKTMRASVYVLGALLGRCGKARVSLPGGCAWGPRPIDIHLKGIQALGAEIDLDHGYIVADAPKLKGTRFFLDFPSVGATINILLAAVKAEGETVLENVAREPEVTNLVRVLNKMGAKIEGEKTSTLRITGVDGLNPVTCSVIPDRIEAGTYLAAAGLTAGDVLLLGAEPEHLTMVLAKAAEAGIKITVTTEGIRVESDGNLRSVDVETAIYPGFATDMQAQWITLMTGAHGVSLITDIIYPDRFTHVPELMRLGARISMKDNVARVHGPSQLRGAQVMSTDLRASASLVIAALAASGRTDISRIYHLDRGYERLEEKFSQLGARIKREHE